MEGLADVFEDSIELKSNSKRATKRKWREIESIKEKYRLRDELRSIDPNYDYDLADLEF